MCCHANRSGALGSGLVSAEGMTAALVRAGLKARELARKTGTAVVIVRDGILVEERIDDSSLPATTPTTSSRH